MIAKVEIKACPHCGGKAKEESTHGEWEGYGHTTVYCQGKDCKATSPSVEKWNRRVKNGN